MSRKTLIYGGALVGSLVGGYLPALWGAGEFSGTAILLSTIGGIAGAVLAYKFSA